MAGPEEGAFSGDLRAAVERGDNSRERGLSTAGPPRGPAYRGPAAPTRRFGGTDAEKVLSRISDRRFDDLAAVLS